MMITELTFYSPDAYAQIAKLMGQLSQRCVFDEEKLRAVTEDANCHLYVCTNTGGEIVACATLCVYVSPTGRKASVEDVVVSEDCRGRHIGRDLMLYVLERARELAPIELHLTSKPVRVAANALYRSVGFLKKETNAYQMVIE